MKELYIAPEAKLIGFVSSEKIAALPAELPWEGLGITLSDNTTVVSTTDIKIPIKNFT